MFSELILHKLFVRWYILKIVSKDPRGTLVSERAF